MYTLLYLKWITRNETKNLKNKMENQQGPTVYHKEFCSMFCGSLGGRGALIHVCGYTENGYMYMYG